MSVLIKGMDMPKGNSALNVLIYSDGRVFTGYKNDDEYSAVEVKTPHGRLADIDEFRKDNIEALRNAIEQALEKHCFLSDKVRMYEEAVQDVLKNIEHCPTVIESEE